jgi:hypothetical protein
MEILTTESHSLANFVGIVVGLLNVCKIRVVASSLPPRYLLNATWYDTISITQGAVFFGNTARNSDIIKIIIWNISRI